jgi:predicted  nucleic acid-binding Zn-ribbon protein
LVTDLRSILQLHDLDLLERELHDAAGAARLRKLGLAMTPHRDLERRRAQCLTGIDKRWLSWYERALRRYGRGVAAVRDRVCQGCRVTLPTSAAPSGGGSLTQCESCGRVLYWG